MRKREAGLILFVAVVAVLPTTAASARGFSYGVAAAEVTPTSALLWARPLKDGRNYWNKDGAADMATYKAMTREKNDFNVNLGDTIYSDSSPDGLDLPFADTLDLKRQKYRLDLTYPDLLRLRESGTVYNEW